METQALSDQHKEAVRSWVPKVRGVLEKDLTAQLERLGVRSDGKHVPIETMPLSPEARAARTRVEALLRHDALAEGSQRRGYENVLRELTYTFLNRLVGLKCMEARGLLYLPPPDNPNGTPEQTEVITPIPGQARSRYLRDFRAAGGARYRYEDEAEEVLLRDGLTTAFRHITSEIRLLFDPDHEYACVWPTHACLVRVINMINSALPEDAYRAQDFLGWVYQFFNRDEKRRIRQENKGTPQTSYELSVMNQFYTPSWVVKMLVDNTLGRLWVQMHPDSALRSEGPPPLPDERMSDEPIADYLVPQTGEKLRYQRLTEDGQVETYKQARDITLLDPACGTMHFGQYAFGLFYRMYLDEIAHAGTHGWPAEPSVKDPKDIPVAIIENNLFGIDIDPRAIQIASLSLLLTAKEAALRHGYAPQDVHIYRTNLVVANAVNLGEERLRAMIKRLGPRLGSIELQERLFKTVWENLQYVGELGSLIQVREGVTKVLDDWVEQQAKQQGLTQLAWPQQEQQLELGTIRSDAIRQQAHQMELQRRLLEKEATELRRELLNGVEAAAAETATEPAQRLFAEDTARGLKLLEVLSRHYDVVVMNPPYGAFVPKVRDFVRAAYPLTYNDIYAAFIDRATQLVEPEGYVGALVSATFINRKRFEKLRAQFLLNRNPLIVMLDLGIGILDDATVEAAAIVLKGKYHMSSVSWYWDEKDFGFRFRSGSGREMAEHYQATQPDEFYVVPSVQRKLRKNQIDELASAATVPTSPTVVPNPWQNYHRDWDWIQTANGLCLNFAGCLDREEIDRREDRGIQRAIEFIERLLLLPEPASLTVVLIRQLHREMMSEIYPFAGEWRTVDMHKGDGPIKWPFPPGGVEPQMDVLARDVLSRSPFLSDDEEEVYVYVSEVMNEILAIHPFREGNGRLTFMVGNLILMQNGLPPLKVYSRRRDEQRYYAACEAGRILKDYKPLATLIAEWTEEEWDRWEGNDGQA